MNWKRKPLCVRLESVLKSRHSLFAAGLALIFMAGCGGQTSDFPPTTVVTGVVTQNGMPVSGASLTFHSTTETKNAVGRTDSEGKYSLTTFEPGDGAMAGEYNVTLVKYEQQTEKPKTGTTPSAENLLPKKYAQEKTSDLKASVPEGGSVTVDFSLDKS